MKDPYYLYFAQVILCFYDLLANISFFKFDVVIESGHVWQF